MIPSIKKRDGRVVPFNPEKIEQAIEKSFLASGSRKGRETAHQLSGLVVSAVMQDETIPSIPTVEQVQDTVERILIEQGFVRSAKAYILYRAERSRVREMNTSLMKTFETICFRNPAGSDSAAGGADTAMHSMFRFGSEGAQQFYEMFVIDPRYSQAHQEGDIHIHDMDFYTLTTAGTQMDLLHLYQNGFHTAHGSLRKPQNIDSYAALCCIAMQANQGDQHDGQSISNFDYSMAPGVAKTYAKRFAENLARALELTLHIDGAPETVQTLLTELAEKTGKQPTLTEDKAYNKALQAKLRALGATSKEQLECLVDFTRAHAERETDRATHQAMEAMVHTLNTMSGRLGTPESPSTVNYGLCTSPEARMAVRNLLLVTEEGLGSGDPPTYPVQIFRIKEGVNYSPGDPNYDLFRLCIRVSAKRRLPHFSFIDAPFNLRCYRQDDPRTEAAYMGCRARLLDNAHDRAREFASRRGNLFTTTVNLPRIAIKAKGDAAWFFEELERTLSLAAGQLMERFDIIAAKKAAGFPFLMGEGVWLDSETLGRGDPVREVLKHGTLAIGFTGLSETLIALRGAHHGEDEASQNLGLEIVGFIRKFCDELSETRQMNFTCLATPAASLSGRFVRLDRGRYGMLTGITDRDHYTDSFQLPAYCPLSALERISLEAPYHALTNAGHLTAVAMEDGPSANPDTLEKIIRHMHDSGIGYGCILPATGTTPPGE